MSERKRKKVGNDQPLEELYENNVAKIVKETGGKSVRMLLPIKMQNGFIKKRIIEDGKISDEEGNEDADKNQEESKEDNQQEENSDAEVDINTHVRFKLYSSISETLYGVIYLQLSE